MTTILLERRLLLLMLLFSLVFTKIAHALNVTEVVSVKTGTNAMHMMNQFIGGIIDPYNGFAVDAKGNIFIGDDGNFRIIKFGNNGQMLNAISLRDKSLLISFALCFDSNDNLYVRNEASNEVIVFSGNGTKLKVFNPNISVFQGKYERVPILNLTCEDDEIKIVYGVDQIKMIMPVFEDKYDDNFKLISRKTFDDEMNYYRTIREANKKRGYDQHFKDSLGNTYGTPALDNWYGKFLPLLEYSSQGALMEKIDGAWLTKRTKYKVYDYYTMHRLGDWRDARGKNYLIVNWHVRRDGIIYVLLANQDFVKVLKLANGR